VNGASRSAGPARKRSGGNPALLLAGAVVALALPSAVLAFSSNFDAPAESISPRGELSGLMPASVDSRLARTITLRGANAGQQFHFTPAGSANRPGRAVTVAVRVDEQTARAISVRKPQGDMPVSGGIGGLRIAPTAYSLGVSRGYQTFTMPSDARRADAPDLAAFRLGAGGAGEPARLNARIALDEREKTGRAPRTLEGNGEQTVDVGGSYRLSRNINVTAGVRYSQERDRLLPLVDGQKDGQAVYVGTQFRF
jgi:hypothetical protein